VSRMFVAESLLLTIRRKDLTEGPHGYAWEDGRLIYEQITINHSNI